MFICWTTQDEVSDRRFCISHSSTLCCVTLALRCYSLRPRLPYCTVITCTTTALLVKFELGIDFTKMPIPFGVLDFTVSVRLSVKIIIIINEFHRDASLTKTSGPLCVTFFTSVNGTVAGSVRCRMIYGTVPSSVHA